MNRDLASYKAGIERLNANLEAEHAKMIELAEAVNRHEALLAEYRATWTRNFEELRRLANTQSTIIEAMRKMLEPLTLD